MPAIKRRYGDGGYARPLQRRRVAVARRSYHPSGETKHFETAATGVLTNVITVIQPGYVDEGSDVTMRIGRRISPTRLDVQAVVNSTGDNAFLRTVIFRCKGRYTGTASDYITDYKTQLNVDRVSSVIYDNLSLLDSSYNHIFQMNKKFRVGGKQIEFTGTTGDLNSDGQIIMLMVLQADLANDGAYVASTRLWYKDH